MSAHGFGEELIILLTRLVSQPSQEPVVRLRAVELKGFEEMVVQLQDSAY
jgi:hypothetical protein